MLEKFLISKIMYKFTVLFKECLNGSICIFLSERSFLTLIGNDYLFFFSSAGSCHVAQSTWYP